MGLSGGWVWYSMTTVSSFLESAGGIYQERGLTPHTCCRSYCSRTSPSSLQMSAPMNLAVKFFVSISFFLEYIFSDIGIFCFRFCLFVCFFILYQQNQPMFTLDGQGTCLRNLGLDWQPNLTILLQGIGASWLWGQ